MSKYCVFMGSLNQCNLVQTLLTENEYLYNSHNIHIEENGFDNAVLIHSETEFTCKLIEDKIPQLIFKHFNFK